MSLNGRQGCECGIKRMWKRGKEEGREEWRRKESQGVLPPELSKQQSLGNGPGTGREGTQESIKEWGCISAVWKVRKSSSGLCRSKAGNPGEKQGSFWSGKQEMAEHLKEKLHFKGGSGNKPAGELKDYTVRKWKQLNQTDVLVTQLCPIFAIPWIVCPRDSPGKSNRVCCQSLL